MGQPRIEEVVCVHNDGQPRSKWRLGRVIGLITGSDGITRGARVQLGGRNKKSNEI